MPRTHSWSNLVLSPCSVTCMAGVRLEGSRRSGMLLDCDASNETNAKHDINETNTKHDIISQSVA